MSSLPRYTYRAMRKDSPDRTGVLSGESYNSADDALRHYDIDDVEGVIRSGIGLARRRRIVPLRSLRSIVTNVWVRRYRRDDHVFRLSTRHCTTHPQPERKEIEDC